MQVCRSALAFALLAAGLASAQTGSPAPAQSVSQERPLTAAQWDSARATIRHDLDVPDRLPALDAKVWSTFSPTPGVLADRVTYATEDGMLVPAIVYRPDPKVVHWRGKLPGLVIVNGHGGDKFSWYAFYSGMMFAKAGAVVVTYDPIGEGERNAERKSRFSPSPHDVYPPTPPGFTDQEWRLHWGPRVAGLMQVDLAQAVSYLIAQPEVDPKRIATAGYSMGAFVAGVEGAWDTRVHAVLLSGGGVFDAPGGYYDRNALPCQGPPYLALKNLGSDPADRGPMLFALHAKRGPLYIMNGSNDTVMDIPHHGPDWFAEQKPKTMALLQNDPAAQRNLFTNVFYPGINHRTSWVDRDGVEWLNKELHFAFWNTDAKIEAAGITHVSTWINANNVDISKSYIREDREGGLDAVGTGLPGIPRADLMVLPDADWQSLKDHIIWQGWEATVLPGMSVVAGVH